MTTFIDFRYSRALAAALFAGQEKEETEIVLTPDRDNYVVIELGSAAGPGTAARLVTSDGHGAATIDVDASNVLSLCLGTGTRAVTVPLPSTHARIVGLRLGPSRCGVKVNGRPTESEHGVFTATGTRSDTPLRLDCADGVKVLGRGSGRAARWGELFYHRRSPSGLCVELTMDWHHLRAGIPLFSTMTAEELVAMGTFRLRFRSYAYEAKDAETTDFVRLFGCDDPPDIAVHLTPALYDPRTPGIPNLGFAVIETERVHPHLVDRCNRMDRVCVPSTFTRDAFARCGVTTPIDVVLHGVDTAYFRPVETKRPLPGGRGFNFLAVGTHVERKNVRYLVRAFLEEFRDHEDVALFLLLRPEYHTTQNNVALEFTDWEIEAADDSAPIFLWTGYLTREHLRDFYANADAYVMPSNEGFGLTLLEAMACGTPAIGLGHGGVLDFVSNENGILVPPGKAYVARDVDTLPYVGDVFRAPDMRALRAAMRRMVSTPDETRRLGRRARADAERLTWPGVTRELAQCIERTHAAYQAARPSAAAGEGARAAHSAAVHPAHALTFVLSVLDDTDARASLDYLRTLTGGGIRVLCLFTRYARIEDVLRARDHGFVYYRWDGTLENCKVIARSILGRSWIAVLNPGERISGDIRALIAFLRSQPPDVAEVAVPSGSRMRETRLFHVRPQGEPSERTEYSGVTIR